MGRNAVKGTGLSRTMTCRCIRIMKITERVTFQLRIDASDVFNHPSFGNPGVTATAGSTSFGVITSTRFPVGDLGSSRQLQLAGKFIF